MKNNKNIVVLVLVASMFAGSRASAQSETIKKAVENVRQSVDTLVVARDENTVSDLGLRIEAFKKVVNLSISEAKELKIKILLVEDGDKDLKLWKEEMLERLRLAMEYLENQEKKIAAQEMNDIDAVKAAAQIFKEWREAVYVPLIEEINDYFAVQKNNDVLKTAGIRVSKINKDIIKIQKTNSRKAASLKNLLNKANSIIESGIEVKKDAEKAFREKYIEPLKIIIATSTIVTTSTEDLLFKVTTTIESAANSTTTIIVITKATGTIEDVQEKNATGTVAAAEAAIQNLSIKDLVKTSLQKVKEAYQVFIEMSNSVRELL